MRRESLVPPLRDCLVFDFWADFGEAVEHLGGIMDD
jgi:hypothetical protein